MPDLFKSAYRRHHNLLHAEGVPPITGPVNKGKGKGNTVGKGHGKPQGGGGGGTPTLDDEFSSTGATSPWYGNSVYPPALYDSASDTTWFSWEGWSGSSRIIEVTSLDHATGYWSELVAAGSSPLTDDDHGNPAICLDDEGHLHAFHGSHNSDQLHSSTREPVASPGDGSMWAIRAPIEGDYSYPHPVLVGSTIHLLLRKTVSATNYTLVAFPTSALADGVATWGSEVSLVDFGANTRFYQGTVHLDGTDIWIIATKADDADTLREHVYLFVYDTATGAVKNHDGSASVASGSLPVDLAEANADFRLFEHTLGNDDGGIPVLCFDSAGDPHVAFKDGTGTSYAIKHIKRTAGTWSAPATVATVDAQRSSIALVPLSGGEVELWYSPDPGDLWDKGGNMARKVRSAAGAWGSEQVILTADGNALGRPAMVLNGDAEARVIFSEIAEDSLDASAGSLRAYVYGSSGLVPYAAAPADPPASSGETLQLNTENLQLNAEDLTLGA